MKLKVIVHEAEEWGYWAEVPAIPGCATQGDTFHELLKNIYDCRRRLPLGGHQGYSDLCYRQGFRHRGLKDISEKISLGCSKSTAGS